MPTYHFTWTKLTGTSAELTIGGSSGPLSFGEVFERWSGDAEFVTKYCAALLQRCGRSSDWRHRLDAAAGGGDEYRVLVTDPVAFPPSTPDLRFLDQRWKEGQSVLTFPDKRRSGLLVVPNRRSPADRFYDLSTFLTAADDVLRRQYLGAVGLLARQRYTTAVRVHNPEGHWLQVWVG